MFILAIAWTAYRSQSGPSNTQRLKVEKRFSGPSRPRSRKRLKNVKKWLKKLKNGCGSFSTFVNPFRPRGQEALGNHFSTSSGFSGPKGPKNSCKGPNSIAATFGNHSGAKKEPQSQKMARTALRSTKSVLSGTKLVPSSTKLVFISSK